MNNIGIIDYESGNFGSVWNAVNTVTKDVMRITRPDEISKCSHIILPGVGAFAAAMRKLEQMCIINELMSHIRDKHIQFLGICVGMQVLASAGREFEECSGLNLIKGSVAKIDVDTSQFPLPHIGWNSLINSNDSPLFSFMEAEPTFYLVHSYHITCEEPDVKPVFCEYGGVNVTAAISKDNIHGVQFHPEKSQNAGIQCIKNFINL